MKGLERYKELVAASARVIVAMDAIMAEERLSPAWYKALRVNQYLLKQAGHVMEGRTEDGADPAAVEGGGLYACASCEAQGRVHGECNSPACDGALAPRGWDSVEGGAR